MRVMLTNQRAMYRKMGHRMRHRMCHSFCASAPGSGLTNRPRRRKFDGRLRTRRRFWNLKLNTVEIRNRRIGYDDDLDDKGDRL